MEQGERGLRLERFPLVREGTGAEEPEEEVTPRAPPGARRLGVGGGLTSKSTFSPSGILGAVSLKEREREAREQGQAGTRQDGRPGPRRAPRPPALARG